MIRRTARTRWLIAGLLLLTFGVGAARADEGDPQSGTMQTIQDRGTILVGYREATLPFSFLNRGHQPIGFSLDICHGIAEDVASTLHRDLVEADAPAWQTGIRIVYVPVAPNERLPKVISGAIDLECGSTTANRERGKTVAFSPVFFLAGTKLLVSGGATSYRDLAGHTIAVGAGTTNADVVRRLANTVSPPIKIVETQGLDAAYDMLAAGSADAFASDDVLLSGFVATRPDSLKFHIVGDYLSFEPYAITIRRDDRVRRTRPSHLRADGSGGGLDLLVQSLVHQPATDRRDAQPADERATSWDVQRSRPVGLTAVAASRHQRIATDDCGIPG